MASPAAAGPVSGVVEGAEPVSAARLELELGDDAAERELLRADGESAGVRTAGIEPRKWLVCSSV